MLREQQESLAGVMHAKQLSRQDSAKGTLKHPGHKVNREMDENWVLHGIRRVVRDTRGLKIMNEVELQSQRYHYFKTKVEEYQRREQRSKVDGQVA